MGRRFSRWLFSHFRRKFDERSLQGSNLPDLNTSVTLPPEIVDKIVIVDRVTVIMSKSPSILLFHRKSDEQLP